MSEDTKLQTSRDFAQTENTAEKRIPLAFEQRGLWFIQNIAPDCGAYNLIFSIQIDGQHVSGASVTTFLHQLASDFPVLRCAMPADQEGPCMQLYETIQPVVLEHDVSGLDETALREHARALSSAPFSLAQAPLWRVHLLRRDSDSCLLVLAVHHALLDFWSLGLLLQEAASRLGLASSGNLCPDGNGYLSYAKAQEAMIAAPEKQSSWIKYWHTQLNGVPPVHDLVTDFPRPAVQVYRGKSLPFMLDRDVSDGIRKLAQKHAATPFMVMLSVFFFTLQRFSGSEDFVVASPVAGRTERAQRAMLGQFVNTLPLRASFSADTTFADLLAQVRKHVIDGLRYQQCPFNWLVEELAPQRDPSYTPLAQIGFSWERLPLLAEFADFFLAQPADICIEHGEFRLSPFYVPQQEGQQEILLEMGGEKDQCFAGTFKYNDLLFSQEFAGEFTARLQEIASAVVRNDSLTSRIAASASDTGSMSRLSGPERKLPDLTLLQLIAEQCVRTPESIALRDQAVALNYRDMWQQAVLFRNQIVAAGTAPGAMIGLCLQRGVTTVTSILGCWLAGCAYVPLEPSFPAERLTAIAEEAGLTLIITDVSQHLLSAGGVPVLLTEDILSATSDPASLISDSMPSAQQQTAYILFTSGSTGKPKGVEVGHRSLLNFMLGMQALFPMSAQDCLLAVTTTAFDISLLELFLPLTQGASVRIADRDTAAQPALLTAILEQEPVTLMQATPATWRMLTDAGWQGKSDMRILSGGDALDASLANLLLTRGREVWNLYGPTETTVWSSAARVTDSNITIGQPVLNTVMLILDQDGVPVPRGVPGELWIGGEGLAKAYRNMPELTADRFRIIPGLESEGRLYKTGDRARIRFDGQPEHLGRLDFQVKLRGYRIETGEIEHVLGRLYPGRNAFVIVREDKPRDLRLVAYLTGEAIPAEGISAALRAVLPGYMIPSAYVFMPSFPLTISGKINRHALPAPQVTVAAGHFAEPRDATEIQLARIFAECLGLAEVGIHDDFFAMGGHSLLAVRLVASIKETFGAEIAVGNLIQFSTVAALAAYIRGENSATKGSVITLRPGTQVQPVWMFHPIGGNVFCYLELNRHLNAARPVIAFQSPGLEQTGEADVTVEDMAARYLRDLRATQAHGPYLLGGWCFGGVIAYESARQLRAAGEQVRGIFLIDSRAPVPANVPSDADDATLLSWFARDLAAPFNKTLTISPETLRQLEPDQMFTYVLNRAKEIAVLPVDADAEQLQRYFEVYIGNGIALQTYFPDGEEIPALLIKAQDEKEDFGPDLGWSELISTSLTQIDLRGDHNSIMYAPQAKAVAAEIERFYPNAAMEGFLV